MHVVCTHFHALEPRICLRLQVEMCGFNEYVTVRPQGYEQLNKIELHIVCKGTLIVT